MLGCYILFVTLITTGCVFDIKRDPIQEELISRIEEYVSRVGKRLLIVINDQKIEQLDIVFKLNNLSKALIKISSNQLIISKGVLNELKDEAELAAILAMAIVNITKINPYYVDEHVINYLYKAGYDPMALVDLQRNFLSNKGKKIWLNKLFNCNISKISININRNLAISLSPETQRFASRYQTNIRDIKKLD